MFGGGILAVNEYRPSSLPPVTAVQVLDLRGVEPYPAPGYLSAAGTPAVTVHGRAAARIADLWRRLPPGHAARCHTPPFGLRFLAGDEVIGQGSVCWGCNTIYGHAGGAPLFYAFDATAGVSVALLAELERVAGAEAGAEPGAAPDAGR